MCLITIPLCGCIGRINDLIFWAISGNIFIYYLTRGCGHVELPHSMESHVRGQPTQLF